MPPDDRPVGRLGKGQCDLHHFNWASSKWKPIPFKKLRRLPRMQEAKDYFRERGSEEIDEWRFIRTYLNYLIIFQSVFTEEGENM